MQMILWKEICLVGKVLRSPYAHAYIKNIDVEEAAKLEGVYAIITS